VKVRGRPQILSATVVIRPARLAAKPARRCLNTPSTGESDKLSETIPLRGCEKGTAMLFAIYIVEYDDDQLSVDHRRVIDNERSGARVGSKNSKDKDRVDDEKTAPGWAVDASAIGWPPRLIRWRIQSRLGFLLPRPDIDTDSQ
jgi:hypothetical protein